MKLADARALIVSAPNTYLTEAARTVLALLDAGGLGQAEATEAHLKQSLELRDRLAAELEEARRPDPDLARLRRLETAVRQLRTAMPFLRTEGRAAWRHMVSLLEPHLTP